MQITVKILQGAECQLEVSEQMTISSVKALVEAKLNVPQHTQKLVFRGKTLQDTETIASTKLPAGAKVFLVTAKPPAAAAGPAAGSAGSAGSAAAPPPAAARQQDVWAPLRTLAEKHLAKEEAARFTAEFGKIFEARLACMSMDDIQRFCAADMKEF